MLLVISPNDVQASYIGIQPTVKPGIYYTDTNIEVGLITLPGVKIIYTIDGSTPIATMNSFGSLNIKNGRLYNGPISIRYGLTRTIKAISFRRWYEKSPVFSFTYEVYSPFRLMEAARIKHSYFNYITYNSKLYYKVQRGNPSYFNKYNNGNINCTWYTYAKSIYYNTPVLFTSAGGLDGRQWFGKVVPSIHQIKYAGNNGLEALISANKNRPIYNVIVSFEKNGSGTSGHVMMIDAIINGKIYYSESFSPGVWKSEASVSNFKSKYYAHNGSIVGVVHLIP